MKNLLIASVAIAAFATPALADFYIVQDSATKRCTITESKPTTTTTTVVGGDGKVYLLSQQGELTVISARADWEVLHSMNFDEDILATPAIVDGRIYIRTAAHLYCFGGK